MDMGARKADRAGAFRRPWDRVCEAQNAYELTTDELDELLSGLPIFEPQWVPLKGGASHSVARVLPFK